jgi:hypothetical protein
MRRKLDAQEKQADGASPQGCFLLTKPQCDAGILLPIRTR